jgi:ketosteroid isomerase-like protein
MAIDRKDVRSWLEAYIEAWRSYDPEAIGALFAEDGLYRYHPWDEPLRGRDAIVASWLMDADASGSWEAQYEPLAVDGDFAIATGHSRYLDSGGSLEKEYANCFLIRFDADGRCSSFTEWFMKKPSRKPEAVT